MKRNVTLQAPVFAFFLALACATPRVCHAQPQASGAPASADDNTRVRALFRSGVAAYSAGKNEEAVKTLSEAWSIRKTYDVAAALAQAEIPLKRYRDAAEHLDFCLSHFAPIESEQTLQQIQKAFADVKLHVGALKITADHAGAEVHVDDRIVGTSPLEATAFVDPGAHTILATLAGDQVTQTAHVDPGEEAQVELKFGAAKVALAAPTASPGPDSASDNQRSIVPVIVGGAVFAVGLAGAIGFELAASSKSDTANSLSAHIGQSGCSAGTASASDCNALRDAQDGKDRDHHWAAAGFVLAGVAAVATPIYWFWPRSDSATSKTSARAVAFRAGMSPAGANISVSGQF